MVKFWAFRITHTALRLAPDVQLWPPGGSDLMERNVLDCGTEI